MRPGHGTASRLTLLTVATPVGPPATTNNPACALASADAVKQAFGASTTAQLLPGENTCRYTFGSLGTPGPDSIILSIQLMPGQAYAPGFATMQGTKVDGVGDRAAITVGTEPRMKSDRPPGDQDVTVLDLSVVRGKNAAVFTVRLLVSTTGPAVAQTKDQLIALARGIQF